MSPAFDRILERAAREARRRHARWDPGRFDRLARGPAAALRDRIEGQPHAEATLSAYAALLGEAVGAGYLDGAEGGEGPGHRPNFLAFGLLDLVPSALAEEPPADRVACLATLWNLGEGLLSGPPWLDRYALSCAAGLRRVGGIESFLVEALGPALATAGPASWSGPFAVTVLDARPVSEEFLPGEMHLAAPRVVCVANRRAPDRRLGLLLEHGGRSRWLGPMGGMDPYVEDGPLPRLGVVGGKARVGSKRVELPMLGEAHHVAPARAGFVVVSAVDSQRLWIVETP